MFKLETDVGVLSVIDTEFLELVKLDIQQFLLRSECFKSVLLFPPVSPFRRFLIHQLVDKSFSSVNLRTFSIGKDSRRRTVICSAKLLRVGGHLDDSPASEIQRRKMITMVTDKNVKNSGVTGHDGNNTTNSKSSRMKSTPALTLYRPPAVRNVSQKCRSEPQSPILMQLSSSTPIATVVNRPSFQLPSHSATLTKKTRRPDQQMYVPRARRSETNQQTQSKKHQPVCTPVKRQLPLTINQHQTVQIINDGHSLNSPVLNGEHSSIKENRLSSNSDFNDSDGMLDSSNNSKTDNSISSCCSCSSSTENLVQFLHELQKDFEHHSSLKSLSDSQSSVLIENESNSFSCKNLCDSGTSNDSTKLDSNILCDIDIFTDDDSNSKGNEIICAKSNELNSGSEVCVDNDKNVSFSKRKEFSESEMNDESIVDHKAKQIHLTNDSDTEVIVNLSNTDMNIRSTEKTTCVAKEKNMLTVANDDSSKITATECDWESLFDDEGNCLEAALLDELSESVGKVKVTNASNDYRSFQTVEERTNDGECIIEIYGFPAEFKTRDLLSIFAAFRNRAGFQIKWVDDTHALAVFNSPIVADEVLQSELPFVKTRPLRLALPESRNKARTIPIVLPPTARPKTCPALAKRLVSGALGLRIPTDRKKREEEKLILKEARDQRRLAAKQREAAWEGTLGNVNGVSS